MAQVYRFPVESRRPGDENENVLPSLAAIGLIFVLGVLCWWFYERMIAPAAGDFVRDPVAASAPASPNGAATSAP